MGINFKNGGSSIIEENLENLNNNVSENISRDFDIVEYNIQADKTDLAEKYIDSHEIDSLVSTISINDPESIVAFGKEVAGEISKCSDMVLSSMDMDQISDAGDMLKLLGKTMDKFDLEDIKKKPGLLDRILGKSKNHIDKLLGKYNTMGAEVDKIYVNLKQYEDEIQQSNKKLESMFNTNVSYYHELLKYILAGEQGIKEIDHYIQEKTKEFENTQDNSIKFELESLHQSKGILEQRLQDLKISENMALQSIPMLKTMQFNNVNLIRKINSAFVITLPIFKQSLSQAILLKRQKIQSEAMSALDEKTNEMLIKNAQTTVEQSKLTAKMATGNSVKIETLENTWKTIVKGIEETRKIQENASKKRLEDQKRLEAIKKDFNRVYGKNSISNK
ncbi:toxic anion resistance protein [Fusobacterium sp. PH5-44]|uniref:toxic anion resistance protein n=1 Tax=unclassified Fusobacterium TaxID=2648384 RepID=UPI003D225BFA